MTQARARLTLTVSAGLAMLLTVFLSGAASADSIQTFQPNPPNLYDLDHYQYYKWGISVPDYSPGSPVASAQLIFSNIRNWDDDSNKLYIHLLDTAPAGVRTYNDEDGDPDSFAGQGALLKTYVNLPTTPQTLTYNLTSAQLATLNLYLANGNDLGFGFDPSCHYYNSGITFQMGTPAAQVPEPGTLALVGTGVLVAFGIFRRRRMK